MKNFIFVHIRHTYALFYMDVSSLWARRRCDATADRI